MHSGAAWLVSDQSHEVTHGNFGCGIAGSFDAKMLALARGLHAALTQVPEGITKITICRDNLSALRQIVRPIVGPSQMVAIMACQTIRTFLSGCPEWKLTFMWMPSHKGIASNKRVDQLAKDTLKKDQPKFVFFSMAQACIKACMMCKWEHTIMKDGRNFKYRGHQFWVDDVNKLHGSKTSNMWLLLHCGQSNKEMARVARTLTNHMPTAEFCKQFNIPGPTLCNCGELETRAHILFKCPNWIRLSPVKPVILPSMLNTCIECSIKYQCGWSVMDVLIFLQANPLVATFN